MISMKNLIRGWLFTSLATAGVVVAATTPEVPTDPRVPAHVELFLEQALARRCPNLDSVELRYQYLTITPVPVDGMEFDTRYEGTIVGWHESRELAEVSFKILDTTISNPTVPHTYLERLDVRGLGCDSER